MTPYAPWPVGMQAERLVLELRELLVRNDENQKAHRLLQGCVPYFLEDGSHAWLEQARAEQARMVAHLDDPERYAAYYAANVHERPFEEQYGIDPRLAHEHLWRVAVLRDWITDHAPLANWTARARPRLLDLGSNDGWMAVTLKDLATVDGVDLHPGNVDLAQRRGREHDLPGVFIVGAAEQADTEYAGADFDAVVAFEVVEHVADPDRLLQAMRACLAPGGRMWLSTPDGAVERGDLPTWWQVEPKGHVRVYTPRSLRRLIARHGAQERDAFLAQGPDGTLVAHWTPA